ncbi:hypothetical protein PGIGA_G00184310 [Pangasianodon gigas]|uniref:Uncharacterized protein n=1 Tax=Pangasianodon gigas TaxID=30993 RepID=A0ACC5WAJ8_PANGG|nr:hypothetical protein [Pangasianodon gigas]
MVPCYGLVFRVYSHLTLSAPGNSPGSTTTLTRIKRFLKVRRRVKLEALVWRNWFSGSETCALPEPRW